MKIYSFEDQRLKISLLSLNKLKTVSCAGNPEYYWWLLFLLLILLCVGSMNYMQSLVYAILQYNSEMWFYSLYCVRKTPGAMDSTVYRTEFSVVRHHFVVTAIMCSTMAMCEIKKPLIRLMQKNKISHQFCTFAFLHFMNERGFSPWV